jgi:hypothetical protein
MASKPAAFAQPRKKPRQGAGLFVHRQQALKLSAYGIPLDWVYEGKMTNLHPHIRAKIRELQSDG